MPVQLMVFVIDAQTDLGEFLADLAKMGLEGGTVLESRGMARVLAGTGSTLGIRHLMSRKAYNNTIFSVVTRPELIERAKTALREGKLRGKGVAFHCPVVKTLGLQLSKPAGEATLLNPTFDIPVAISSWEIEPHPARWVDYQEHEIRLWVTTDYHVGAQVLVDLSEDFTVPGRVRQCTLAQSGFEIIVQLPRLNPDEVGQIEELVRAGG